MLSKDLLQQFEDNITRFTNKTYMLSKMERLTARPSKASPEALEAMNRRNKDICCVFVFRAVILQKRN